MTTISFDGVMLAADRQATHDFTPVTFKKLHKIEFRGEPAYAGCAGIIEQWSKVMDWIVSGCSGDFPEFEEKDFSVMIVTKSKRLFYCNDSPHFHEMTGNRWAIGTGANYALGAMAAGKNAKEAVEIACELDVNSGLGVDSVLPGRL